VRKADNLTTILCRCHEIWEPVQTCNGIALPLPYYTGNFSHGSADQIVLSNVMVGFFSLVLRFTLQSVKMERLRNEWNSPLANISVLSGIGKQFTLLIRSLFRTGSFGVKIQWKHITMELRGIITAS